MRPGRVRAAPPGLSGPAPARQRGRLADGGGVPRAVRRPGCLGLARENARQGAPGRPRSICSVWSIRCAVGTRRRRSRGRPARCLRSRVERRNVALPPVGPPLGRRRPGRAMRAGSRRRSRAPGHGERQRMGTAGHRRRLLTRRGGGSGTVLPNAVGPRTVGSSTVGPTTLGPGTRTIGCRGPGGRDGAHVVAPRRGPRARSGPCRRRGTPVAVVDHGAGGFGVVTGVAEPRRRCRAQGVDLPAQPADLAAQGVTLAE